MSAHDIVKWLALNVMSIKVDSGTMTINYLDRDNEKTIEVNVMGDEKEAIMSLHEALEGIV